MQYHVVWVERVEADSPRDAARVAQGIFEETSPGEVYVTLHEEHADQEPIRIDLTE